MSTDINCLSVVPQVRSDWFVYAVLSCLPWVGQELAMKKPHDLDALFASIESYIMYVLGISSFFLYLHPVYVLACFFLLY